MQRRSDYLLFFAALGFLSYILVFAYQTYQASEKQSAPRESHLERILKSAHNNNPQAQAEVAECYNYGRCGLALNQATAFEWYKKAADQGLQDAQIKTAYFYQTGEIIPKNLTEAIRYYSQAAEAKEPVALRNLAMAYEEATDIPDHKLKSAVLFLESAEAGDSYAAYKTGMNYYQGNGLVQDDIKAYTWLNKAYTSGEEPRAASRLGMLYLQGRGTPKNVQKAAALFKKQADKGEVAEAAYIKNHADFCQNIFQYKFTPDFLESCLFAAEAGDAQTQYTLATIIKNGSLGDLPHRPQAEYLEMAGHQGYYQAQIELAHFYGGHNDANNNAHQSNVSKAYGWLYAVSCRAPSNAQEQAIIAQAKADLIPMESKLSPAIIQQTRSDFSTLCTNSPP